MVNNNGPSDFTIPALLPAQSSNTFFPPAPKTSPNLSINIPPAANPIPAISPANANDLPATFPKPPIPSFLSVPFILSAPRPASLDASFKSLKLIFLTPFFTALAPDTPVLKYEPALNIPSPVFSATAPVLTAISPSILLYACPAVTALNNVFPRVE